MNKASPSGRARAKLPAFAPRLACAALVACALAQASARAQLPEVRAAAPKSERKEEGPPKSVVYGRAVYEGTNRPARRTQVMLVGADPRTAPDYTTLTDAEGRFRFKAVNPGRYVAFVQQTGVLAPFSFIEVERTRGGGGTEFDRAEMLKFFEEVEVDGKAERELTVHARRGAAISGKVAYADGAPAVNVRIRVMRRRDGGLARYLPGFTSAAVLSLTTDDRGSYRVTGLPPGEYVVAAVEATDHGDEQPSGAMDEHLQTYLLQVVAGDPLLVTYHPSETRAVDAAGVKVAAGDEREGVDITLAERELRDIAGVVRDGRRRRPLPNVAVTLTRKPQPGDAPPGPNLEEQTQPTVKTDAEGRWRLTNVPHGEYSLAFTPPPTYESAEPAEDGDDEAPAIVQRRRKLFAPAGRELRVGPDTAGLVVELGDAGRVAGTVAVEGGSPPDHSGISFVPADPKPPAGPRLTVSTPAFRDRFEVDGLAPGRYNLLPFTTGETAGSFYLKSVTWDGRDLMREPLEVTEGADIEGVRVVYGRDPARLRVRVRAHDDRPVSGALVFLVPPDPASSPAAAARTFQCFTGDDGSCQITAAPGEYAVVAVAAPRVLRPSELGADLRRRAAAAPRVTLGPNETSTFDLAPARED